MCRFPLHTPDNVRHLMVIIVKYRKMSLEHVFPYLLRGIFQVMHVQYGKFPSTHRYLKYFQPFFSLCTLFLKETETLSRKNRYSSFLCFNNNLRRRDDTLITIQPLFCACVTFFSWVQHPPCTHNTKNRENDLSIFVYKTTRCH